MKFTCTKNNFNNGINIALKAVPGKTTMPILECVVIEAKEDYIKLTTNDMQLGIETKIPAQVDQDGIILVNAKMIADIVRRLPDEDVNFEVDASDNILLFCGKSKFNIPGLGREFVNAISGRDYTMIMGLTIFMGMVVILVNLLTDLIRMFLEPQVRRSK